MRPSNRLLRRRAARFSLFPSERGGSVVVAAVALPLLLTFLLALLDIGRVVFLAAETDTAAHAVRCLVEAQAESASRPGDLDRSAREASPSLGGEGLELDIVASVGEVERREYGHKLFDGKERAFFERSAQVSTRPLEVTVSVRGYYLTPVGALIAQASGVPDASFSCKAHVRGLVDETIEGGVW